MLSRVLSILGNTELICPVCDPVEMARNGVLRKSRYPIRANSIYPHALEFPQYLLKQLRYQLFCMFVFVHKS